MKKVASISAVILGAIIILYVCLQAVNFVAVQEHYSPVEQKIVTVLALAWMAGIEICFIYLRFFRKEQTVAEAPQAILVAIEHTPAMRMPSPSDEQLASYMITENGIYIEDQVA